MGHAYRVNDGFLDLWHEFSMRRIVLLALSWACVSGGVLVPALAFDYEGHRLVNQLALTANPEDGTTARCFSPLGQE